MVEALQSALDVAESIQTASPTQPNQEEPLPDPAYASALPTLARRIEQMERHEERGSLTTWLGLDPTYGLNLLLWAS